MLAGVSTDAAQVLIEVRARDVVDGKIRKGRLVFEVASAPADTGYSDFHVVITDETNTTFTTDEIHAPLTLFKRPSDPGGRLKMEATEVQSVSWTLSRKAHSAICLSRNELTESRRQLAFIYKDAFEAIRTTGPRLV
jgi:hypothetical protein